MKQKIKKGINIYYFYDREADVFYLSQEKPKTKVKTVETADDVVLRLDPRSGRIIGFTILNFANRLKKKKFPYVPLPIQAELTPAR